MSKKTKVLFKILDVFMIFMLTFGSPMSALAQVWTVPADASPGSLGYHSRHRYVTFCNQKHLTFMKGGMHN